MGLRDTIKKIPYAKPIYHKLRKASLRKLIAKIPYAKPLYKKLTGTYPFAKPRYFLNNSRNSDTACFILAGYNEFTWDIVFKRIETFAPQNIDICLVSSGVFSEKLKEIAIQKGWSYIAMRRNCITLALNSAIRAFPSAQYIYKLDEDIFVTKGFFENIRCAHEKAKKDYTPGFSAPIIPINSYGYRKVLEKLNLVEEYTNRFEYPKITTPLRTNKVQIYSNPDTALFMWERGGQIDELARLFTEETFNLCPIRFQIGAVYFEKKTLEDEEYFPVRRGSCWALDETLLCSLGTVKSRVIVIANNALVGHLSFGTQKKVVKEYFLNNKDFFDIKNPTK